MGYLKECEDLNIEERGPSLWQSKKNGKYYFNDEAEQLDGPYDTLELAMAALDDYIKHL